MRSTCKIWFLARPNVKGSEGDASTKKSTVPHQDTTAPCPHMVTTVRPNLNHDSIDVPKLHAGVLDNDIRTSPQHGQLPHMQVVVALSTFQTRCGCCICLLSTSLPLGGKGPAMGWDHILNRMAKELLCRGEMISSRGSISVLKQRLCQLPLIQP